MKHLYTVDIKRISLSVLKKMIKFKMAANATVKNYLSTTWFRMSSDTTFPAYFCAKISFLRIVLYFECGNDVKIDLPWFLQTLQIYRKLVFIINIIWIQNL